MGNIFRTGTLLLFVLLTTATRNGDPGNDYFTVPVQHDLRLSGTFGELRWNHFHTGLDFKSSNGRAGDPVYAVQEGFVSRIKVEEDGYGRALYIDHPNGFTSVYGHLHNFSDSITAWVRAKQYKLQSFAINEYLPDSVFRVQKGQRIGSMGNAGSSSGVHLHFELRDTKSEIPCNPLLLGYSVDDSKPPVAYRLKWSVYDPYFQELESDVLRLRVAGNALYRPAEDTIRIPAGKIGFAVQSSDQMDGTWNRNGIYGMRMYRDSSPAYSFQMRCVSFDDLRYLNAHIDYEERYHNRRYYHRLHSLPGNKLDLYDSGDGWVHLREGETATIRIELFDASKNTSRLRFPVKAVASSGHKTDRTAEYVWPEEPYTELGDRYAIHLPKNSLYKPVPWSFHWDESSGELPGFEFLTEDIPLHHAATVRIPLGEYPAKNWSKMYLERRYRGSWEYAGGEPVGDALVASLDRAGRYRLAEDHQPPSIRPVHMSRNLSGWNRIRFRIDDAVAHPLQFEGCIDGRWILMEYDEKNRSLTHELSDTLSKGTHFFELTVWDDRANEAHYSLEFQR